MNRLESGFIVVWTIENFRFFPYKAKNIYKCSPYFQFPPFNTKWYMLLTKVSNSLICYLIRTPGQNSPIKFQCKIEIEDDFQSQMKETVLTFESNNDCNLFFYDDPNQEYYLSSRNFRLICLFSYDSLTDFPHVLYLYFRSHIKVVKFNFDWFIHNFDSVDSTGMNLPELKMCYASLKVNMEVSKSEFNVDEYLLSVLVSNMQEYTVLQFNITLFNCHGKAIGYAEGINCNEITDTSQPILFKLKGDNGIPISLNLPDNTLKLCFEIEETVGEEFTNSEGRKIFLRFQRKGNRIIELDQYATEKGKNKDLQVIIGNKSYPANKAYVCDVSPYFKELVGNSNSLSIPPGNLAAQLLLNFPNCQKLPELSDFKLITQMFINSRNLQIEPLIRTSSRVLVSSFSLENISEVFLLLHKFDVPYLRKTAMLFFNANIKKILNCDEWKAFLNRKPEIAYGILRTAFLTKLHENSICT